MTLDALSCSAVFAFIIGLTQILQYQIHKRQMREIQRDNAELFCKTDHYRRALTSVWGSKSLFEAHTIARNALWTPLMTEEGKVYGAEGH